VTASDAANYRTKSKGHGGQEEHALQKYKDA